MAETTFEAGESQHARRILTQIAPRAWEHPADRAALMALRRIPVFDQLAGAVRSVGDSILGGFGR